MDQISKAAKILKEGGIVIFPTDTAFAIGCRIDRQDTISRLFTVKRRPGRQATPVLVSSIFMASHYLQSPLPDNVRRLMKHSWPGGLTIVTSCNIEKVPILVRGGGTTLGVRMPKHNTALSLIKRVGVPILGPSANFHGEKTPFSYEELDPRMKKQVDFVMEGVCTTGHVSTVINCSKNPWTILRQGAVSVDLP